MPINFSTVTIGGKNYPVLVPLQDAIDYLAIEPTADAWREGDDDDRSRWLAGATRSLLRIVYLPGTLDGPNAPAALQEASMILAGLIAGGFDPDASPSAPLRRQKAGSVEQDFYFLEASSARFPRPMMDLLGPLLGSTGMIAPALATGVSAPSAFCDDYSTVLTGAASDDENRWQRAYE